jgi:predicted TIM-barrel fold metal-dependent hydrolase
VWKAIDDAGMAVVFHSTFGANPNFPGRHDLWDNAIVGRAAAHPWGAMRAIGAFMGAGTMERYPSLRFGILESGCGWLPFWARRMDSQLVLRPSLAPEMHKKYEETFTGGRFFSSIEMSEGEDMIQMVADFLGPNVLMYASDYPHHESMFPESTDHFLGWDLSDELRRKLLWDNPVGLYGEP